MLCCARKGEEHLCGVHSSCGLPRTEHTHGCCGSRGVKETFQPVRHSYPLLLLRPIQAMFAAALGALAALRMRASMVQVQPAAEDILDIKQVRIIVGILTEHANSKSCQCGLSDIQHA